MSTPQPTTPNPEQEPIIPPSVLLIIAAVSFLLAVGVLFTQTDFGVVGFGALGVGIISLVVWAAMNPDDFMNLLRGRAVSFGGTAILVSVLVIIASIVLYAVIDSAGLFVDLTAREEYSLNDEVGDIITAIGSDPASPQVRLIGFYDVNQAAERDRVEVLLDEIATLSNGKVSYEFIDLNRAPQVAELYADPDTGTPVTSGQIVVAPIDPATGEPDPEQSQIVSAANSFSLQYELTNVLISVTAGGDFRAYFLALPDTVDMEATDNSGGSTLTDILTENFNWQVESINPLAITGDEPQVVLNDPVANGEVVVITGGSQPLPDDVFTSLTTYLENGGDLVLLGFISLDGQPLIAADNLSNYLYEHYGVRVNDDLVIDRVNSIQDYFTMLITEFGAHPITTGLGVNADSGVALNLVHSIDIADTLPPGVTVTPLLTTSDQAYSRTGIDLTQEIDPQSLLPTANDEVGQKVLAVAIEDSNTGTRIVLGSRDWAYNAYWDLYPSVVNGELLRRSMFWAASYEDFFSALVNITPQQNVDEFNVPLVITNEDARLLGFVSLLLLPFGVLGAGILQWWLRRSRR
ncbi:MAG: Gldg family protein [Anaerolineae bacterium]|nr:Gldg family protein [Anaerolineae bacterium]